MWHDPTTNTLVYESHDARLLQHVPGARQLTNGYIGLPVTLLNLQICRMLGYPVIRPLGDYDWPRSRAIKEPFHAQIETANFLAVHPKACVLSDMGTGKTLSSLWAADALMCDAEQRGETFRALIVAPLSTLSTVWADAIFGNFMGKRKSVILHGSSEQRIKALAEDADFYLVNHDGIKVGAKLIRVGQQQKVTLSGFSRALSERTDIRLAIVDEVGAFRDHRSLRSRVAKHILAPRDHLWLMTGTPTPNGPTDAYGIAKLLNNAKGEPFTHYKQRAMTQVSQFKWVPRAGAHEAAQALMQPSIRFSIEDCVDLPELTTQTRDVELSPEQTKAIKALKNDLLLEINKGTVTVANEAALRIKMIQVACGGVYDSEHSGHKLDCRPRVAVVRELIEESGSKVIIFAPFIFVVNMLNSVLKEYSRRVILGSTPVKERNEIIRAFQQERDPHVLIAHPETISHGQTLTAASTTVWYGPTDKTDVYIQANKRMHRPGQKRPCAVVNLAATPLEREIYRRLASNESMQGLLLKLVEEQRL
jgi:SNF2 family DNA or RNA helicase